MALDAFLKIDGITSDKADGIELESFSWGVSNTGTAGGASGIEAGRATFSDFNFTSLVGSQSPQLFVKCVEGYHVQSALLTISGTPSQIMIKFTDVLVSSYQLSQASLQKYRDEVTNKFLISEMPMESVSLNFAKIEYVFGSTVGTGGSTPTT